MFPFDDAIMDVEILNQVIFHERFVHVLTHRDRLDITFSEYEINGLSADTDGCNQFGTIR